MDGVEFVQGLPDFDALDPTEKHLIIIDDQMNDLDQKVANLFTNYSHHRNLSVMLIVQNLFNRNKYHRKISLYTHYMILFKNTRDMSQIMALAHQMYPRRTQFVLEAFARATAKPHGYVLTDMKKYTPDILRLRSTKTVFLSRRMSGVYFFWENSRLLMRIYKTCTLDSCQSNDRRGKK